MIVSYLAYVATNGIINHICTTPSDMPENGSMFEDMTIRYIYKSEESDIGFESPAQFINQYWWKNNSWVKKGDPPADLTYYTWDMATEAWIFNTTALMSEIRRERSIKLMQTDWTQLADSPLTESKKQEWSVYRQQLRDLPQNQPSLTSLEEVVWPTPPTN
jgi:hypothetical protein